MRIASRSPTCYLLGVSIPIPQLRGSLGDIMGQLQPILSSLPRRVAGEMSLEGRPFRYVDLHSFYHQVAQIFGQQLYGFESASDSPVIYDCGAHIGLATLFFKQKYPKSRVLAFEADPTIFAALRFNLESFGLSDVDARQCAVWVHSDGVAFESSSDDSGRVTSVLPTASSGSTRVPSVRLRELLSQAPVDLLKLDIEGAEFDVIADCADVLPAARCLLIEAHALAQPQRLGSLLATLERAEFRYVLGDLHPATWLPNDVRKPPFSFCAADKFIVSVFAWRT